MPSDAQIQHELEDRLRRLNEIGMALSSVQHNLNALLERIRRKDASAAATTGSAAPAFDSA